MPGLEILSEESGVARPVEVEGHDPGREPGGLEAPGRETSKLAGVCLRGPLQVMDARGHGSPSWTPASGKARVDPPAPHELSRIGTTGTGIGGSSAATRIVPCSQKGQSVRLRPVSRSMISPTLSAVFSGGPAAAGTARSGRQRSSFA